MRIHASLLFAFFLLGCGESHGGPDAGARLDSGTSHADGATADASPATDAGSVDGGPACAFIDGIDRHCLSDGECASATHQTNCCGTEIITGISASESARFATLEAACVASYPGCGCASGPTTTDSGETVTDPSAVQVGCITRGPGGVCMTYVTTRPPNGR